MPWNRLLALGLLAVNALLGYRLFFSEQGLLAYLDMRGRQDELTQRMAEADEKCLQLSTELRLLKEDRAYIEKAIRQQLNYVRPSEVLYTFPALEDAAPAGGPHASKN